MSKDPAFLFYYQDYAWGTRHMSYEEKGRYMDLLCEQADYGAIEPEHFHAVAGNKQKIIEKFSTNSKGYFYNKRLREVMEKRKIFCKSRSQNRLGKKQVINTSKSSVELMGNRNGNRNGIENTIKKGGCRGKHSFGKSPYFDKKVFSDALQGWAGEKIEHYYNAAIEYSESKGTKYLNWIMAVKSWDRRKPYQERGKNAKSSWEE